MVDVPTEVVQAVDDLVRREVFPDRATAIAELLRIGLAHRAEHDREFLVDMQWA